MYISLRDKIHNESIRLRTKVTNVCVRVAKYISDNGLDTSIAETTTARAEEFYSETPFTKTKCGQPTFEMIVRNQKTDGPIKNKIAANREQ